MNDLITQIADLQVKAQNVSVTEELNSNIIALTATIKDLVAIMAVSGREITPPTAKTEVVADNNLINFTEKPPKKKRASKKKAAPKPEVIAPTIVEPAPEVIAPKPEPVVVVEIAEPVKVEVSQPEITPEPVKVEVSQPAPVVETEVSVEMVNESILAAKARGVNLNQARAVVEQFGVGRVLDLKPEDRPAVRNAVNAL